MTCRIQKLLCCFVFVASAAQADPITVSFTAFPAANDPVNPGPSTGSFTFDSGLIPPAGGLIQDSTFGLGAIGVDFRWGSTLFTRANADLGELQFSATGQLLAWVLGGTESPTGMGGIYSYITSPPSAVIDDIFVTSFAGVGGAENFTYTLAGIAGEFRGHLVTDSVPAPVPEPSSMLLLGTGIVVLARRARMRPDRRTTHAAAR